MRLKIVIILIFSFLTREATSQINIMGKPGYINTPSANRIENNAELTASYAFLPGEYSLFKEGFTLNFFNTRVAFTSFFDVGLTIAYRQGGSVEFKQGIGERHLDFRFYLIKERKFVPALVLGWTPPGSVAPYLSHDYLVLSKNFKTRLGHLRLSTGYGSPYVFLKNPSSESFLDLSIQKKEETRLNSSYLTDFFAGLNYQPVPWAGLLAEYDSNTINAGAYVQPWEWLTLQGHTYEGREFAFSAALNFSLSFLPHSLRRHEKAQN